MAHSKSEIKKAKNLLNKYAPKGEQLAYINSKEAKLLKRMGGAGKDVNVSGIKSYYRGGSPADSHNNESTSSTSYSGGDDYSSQDNEEQQARDTAAYNSGQRSQSYQDTVSSSSENKSILSKAGSGIVDYIKTGGTIGLVARNVGKAINYVTKNIGGKITRTSYNPMNIQPQTKPITGGGGNGGSDNPPAQNVGGRIVKLSPTTAEISQSSATDASPYDLRKTKAKGRSMTIMTSSRGINRNNTLTLGKPSLLGA
jgi:hypothetical protein